MQHKPRGFSLVELSVAMTILTFAVVALMEFLGSATAANRKAADLTTAVRLARSVSEYALTLDHSRVAGSAVNDLADLNARTFSPPQDSRGVAMGANMKAWTQSIQVVTVDPDTLADVTVPLQEGLPKRLIVTISHNGKTLYSQRWLLCPMLSDRT